MLRMCSVVLLSILVGCSRTGSAPESSAPAGGQEKRAAKELIFNTYLPPQDAVRRASVEDFARRIEQESGGALKVIIPDSSLGNSSYQWGIVTEGVADLAVVPVFSQRAQIKLPLLADLPLNCYSAEAASVALWNTQRRFFDKVNEFAEVKLLSMYVLPPFQFISDVTPINAMEDFKGLKIWVAAGPPTEAVKLLGGIPVSSLYSQLFEYASKGNVDALMIGPGTVKQTSIADYVRYMTEIPGGMGSVSFAVVMNKTAFGSLSESEQAAILRAAEGLPRRVGQALDERNRQALEEIKLTINEASPALMAELRKRLNGLEAAWIKSAEQRGLSDAAEALKYYRDEMLAVVNQTHEPTASTSGPAP